MMSSIHPLQLPHKQSDMQYFETLFFKVESGMVVLASTDWLSPSMYVGPSTGMPIILNLYLRPLMY